MERDRGGREGGREGGRKGGGKPEKKDTEMEIKILQNRLWPRTSSQGRTQKRARTYTHPLRVQGLGFRIQGIGFKTFKAVEGLQLRCSRWFNKVTRPIRQRGAPNEEKKLSNEEQNL